MNPVGSIALLPVLALVAACATSADNPAPVPAVSSSAAPTAATRPNVVFILLDDQGFADVGFNGSDIATPNLDQIARSGMRLDRNYVYPICSPTRTALLTGRSPLEFGIDGPMSNQSSLPPDVKIMPQYFKELGYQTYMVGKWHLGVGETRYFPNARGFDYFYGFLGGWVDYYTHVYAGGLDWQRNGVSVREPGHSTDLLTTDAVRLINSQDRDKPFLLYLAYNAPHSPLQHVPTQAPLAKSAMTGDRAVYAGMVMQADAGVGRVIAALDARGLLKNTIVIYSSDNGGSLNLGASNGALRGGKGSAFEGGMRVPGALWWQGHVDGGKVLLQPIVVHDWLPTLLEAVGGDPAAVKGAYGHSMWPAIASDRPVRRAVTTIGVSDNYAAFDWPWKLVQSRGNGADGPAGRQLFNVVEDPGEKTDLSAREPREYARLGAVIDAIPRVPSRREINEPSPNTYFRNAGDTAWDYDVRVRETRGPWAESAVRSTGH